MSGRAPAAGICRLRKRPVSWPSWERGGSPVRTPQLVTPSIRIVVAPLLLAGLAAWVAPATPAVATAARSADPAASFTTSGRLNDVSATSSGNAWAVGGASGGNTLIVHWNGKAWKQVPSPAPASGTLYGVAATSARNAWAVGGNLILHWNGTAWTRVPSPALGTSSGLSGVAAVSARRAWAVGQIGSGTHVKTLILQWNGTTWKRVPSPSPGTDSYLFGVAAVSARRGWAVGYTSSGSGFNIRITTLILQWNGTTWKRVPSPSPGAKSGQADDFLYGVAATSAGSAWAVGDFADCGCGPGVPLIERWNGKAWKRVPSPTSSTGGDLVSVAAVSARNAWAVGLSGQGISPTKTLILRWNGTAWKKARSPAPRANSGLSGVAAVSARGAWAVGSTTNSSRSGGKTLILQWNGTAWR
jgi:hypothetical protein